MAVIALCLWVIVAWVLSLVLTAKQSWPAAYVLIAAGVPILWLLWVQIAPWAALGGFVVGCVVLRWPVIYLGRWIKRKVM